MTFRECLAHANDVSNKLKNRLLEILLLVVAGIPLLIYPSVLVANVMSIAGYQGGDLSVILKITSTAFMLVTTLYPIVYLCSVIGYIVFSIKRKKRWARKLVWLPYKTIGAVIVLYACWGLSSYLGI